MPVIFEIRLNEREASSLRVLILAVCGVCHSISGEWLGGELIFSFVFLK